MPFDSAVSGAKLMRSDVELEDGKQVAEGALAIGEVVYSV
jgi:hypothetical protein